MLGSYAQLGGSASFIDCRSGEPEANLSQDAGKQLGGGGLLVGELLQQRAGMMRFEACRAGFNGGGLLLRTKKPGVLKLVQSGGEMVFSGCAAGRRGGGAAVSGRVQLQGGPLQA